MVINTLNTARQRVVFNVVDRGVDKAAVAYRQADIGAHAHALLAVKVLAVLHLHLATFAGVFHDEVDNAGDRVRAILRRCSVTQDFDLFHGEARNHADIHTMRAVTGGRRKKLHESRAMTSLAVDEHQHLVGRRATQ